MVFDINFELFKYNVVPNPSVRFRRAPGLNFCLNGLMNVYRDT